MTTDIDRVRFVVAFVDQTVLTLNATDLKRLRRGLASFLGLTKRGSDLPGPSGVQVVVVRAPFPEHASKAVLFRLQRDARHLLQDAIEGKGFSPTTISDAQQLSIDVVGGRSATRVLRIGGSMRAGFLLTLAFLLTGEAGAHVLRCPECGRLFVRVRRQKYCQDSCTDKATWRAYPEEKKRLARQKQYEKQGWTLGARSERRPR